VTFCTTAIGVTLPLVGASCRGSVRARQRTRTERWA